MTIGVSQINRFQNRCHNAHDHLAVRGWYAGMAAEGGQNVTRLWTVATA